MTDDKQRYARVPAEMSRAGWSPKSDHVAECGAARGQASSIAGALDELAGKLAAMATRAQAEPTVWWDDANAVLWLAVPDTVNGGHHAYPVKFAAGTAAPERSVCVTSGAAPVAEAMARCEGITRVDATRGVTRY